MHAVRGASHTSLYMPTMPCGSSQLMIAVMQIRAMLGGSGGSIVNLASMAGLHGIPHASTYSATKHAVS